jgi:hypothetical protein
LRFVFNLGIGLYFALLKLAISSLSALFEIKQQPRSDTTVQQFAQTTFVVNGLTFPLREHGLTDFVNTDKSVFIGRFLG